MAQLTSRLIISLIDKTGAGARSVARNLATMRGAAAAATPALGATTQAVRQQSRTMRAFRTIGGHTPGLTGMVGGAGALAFLRNETEVQGAMNRTQAILNETNDERFNVHRDLVVDLAKRYPATSAEIAKGASELAMAGMTMEQVNEVLEATIQGSMASGESIKTVGMGVTDVVMGLGKALTKSNFDQINNVLAAASTSYAQDYTQFLAGFAKTAPLARMLGLEASRLAGFLGILADAGFKAEKGGTALRTSMINAAAPTKKAQSWLAQYNIDLTKFKNRVDKFQLGGKAGAGSLAQYVQDELNLSSESLQPQLERLLSDEALLASPQELKRRLATTIADTFGATDGETSKMIGESVNRWVESGFQQLDLEAFLRHLGETGFDKNVEAMKELFGKRFTAQMAAIINSLRDGVFDKKLEMFLPRIEGAVQRFAGILMKGLPGAVKRLGGAFDGLLRALANSGAIDTVVSGMERLRDVLNSLSATNPGVLKVITLGGLMAAALAPLGFIAMGLGATMTVMGAAVRLAAMPLMLMTRRLWGLGRAGQAATAASAALAATPLFALANQKKGPAAAGGARAVAAANAANAAMLAGMSGRPAPPKPAAGAARPLDSVARGMSNTANAAANGRMVAGMSAAGTAATGAGAGAFAWVGTLGTKLRGLMPTIALVKRLLIGLGRGTVVGVGLTALFAGFQWIANNAAGFGQFLSGIGDGFMKGLGPAKPVVEGVASSLGAIFDWIGRLTGPLDESGAKWRSWGETVGNALAAPVRWIQALVDGVQSLYQYLTNSRIGSWVGRNVFGMSAAEAEAANQAAQPAMLKLELPPRSQLQDAHQPRPQSRVDDAGAKTLDSAAADRGERRIGDWIGRSMFATAKEAVDANKQSSGVTSPPAAAAVPKIELLPRSQLGAAQQQSASPAPPAATTAAPAPAMQSAVPVVGAGMTGLPADINGLKSQARAVETEVHSVVANIRSILASVDLAGDGQRMMESLAAGIRAGAGAVGAAVQETVNAQIKGAMRGAYSDGGYN